MILDIDFLINFFDKNSNKQRGDLGEEESSTSAPSSGGGGSKSMPKWADSYATKRGKANMLGKGGEKWTTGLTRGISNQIW